MAITLRAVSPSATTLATGTSSVALTQPTGTLAGDLLIAYVVDHATTGSSAAPTGWTRQTGVTGTTPASGRFQVFTAVVGQNGLTGTSWTFTGLTTRSGGCMVGYYGARNNYLQVINGTPTTRNNASGTTGTTSVTTTVANALIVGAFASLSNGSTWSAETTATAGALTERVDGAYANNLSMAVADRTLAVAGATGASSSTMLTAVANMGILLAIAPEVSPTVVQNTPTNAATNQSTTPVLNFTGTDINTDTIEYNVQIDTVNTFNSQAGSPLISKLSATDVGFSAGHPFVSGAAVNYTVPSGLLSGGSTYYWRVAGIDPLGSNTYGAWSNTTGYSFTTNYSPVAPTLTAPANGATGQSITPSFSFSTTDPELDAIDYKIQIDTVSTFDSQAGLPLVSRLSETDAGFSVGRPYTSGVAVNFQLQTGDALYSGTYYWRVAGKDISGSNNYGAWSATLYSFTIPAPTVALNSPTDGATVAKSSNVNFTGTSASGGASTLEYNVQIDTAITFDSQISGPMGKQTIGGSSDSGDNTYYNYNKITMGAVGGTCNGFKVCAWIPSAGPADVKLAIYTDNAGVPGTLVAGSSGIVTVSRLTKPAADVDWAVLGMSVSLSANTSYWLAFTASSSNMNFAYATGGTSANSRAKSATTYANFPEATAPVTTAGTHLTSMYLTFMAGGPLLSELSASDAGFTAGHPFASAAAVDFALAVNPGTYYWRVAAKYPTGLGSSAFGSWSSIRSLVILTPGPNSMVQYKSDHATIIPTGGSTININGLVADGILNNDYLDFSITCGLAENATPKVEVCDTKTAFTGTATATGSLFAFNPSVPRFRNQFAMVYDSVNKRVVVWGGVDKSITKFYDETWELKLPTTANPNPMWRQMNPSAHPLAREAMAYCYDSAYNRMIIYGGYDGTTLYNDFWYLNLATPDGVWTQFTPSNPPSAGRWTVSGCYDSVSVPGRFLFFGGSNITGSINYNETWAVSLPSDLSGTNSAAVLLAPTGTKPAVRAEQAVIYDSANKRMIMFAGYGMGPTYNDVWSLDFSGADPVNGVWNSSGLGLTISGTPPAKRADHTMIYDPVNQRMLTFFGYDPQYGTPHPFMYYNDVYELAIPAGSTFTWTNRTDTTNLSGCLPPKKGGAMAVYDSDTKQAIVFGGSDILYRENATLVYDVSSTGSNLVAKELAPLVNLSPTDGIVAVYDDTNQQMIRVGGYGRIYDTANPTATGYHINETWTYSVNNNALNNISSPISYLSGEVMSVVYDSYNKRVIKFGGLGFNQIVSLSDLWQMSMDPTNANYKIWQPLSATGTAPTARWGSAVVYDPVNQRMVLFGGQQIYETDQGSGATETDVSTKIFYQDVYTLSLGAGSEAWHTPGDGTLAALTGSFSPSVTSGLFQSKAVYDPVNIRMIIYGGKDGAATPVYYNSVWSLAWSNVTPNSLFWQTISVTGTPPAGARGHTMIYQGDWSTKRVVIFGGTTDDTFTIYTTQVNTVSMLDITSTNPVWTATSIDTTNGQPTARRSGASIYDPVNKRMITEGGRGNGNPVPWYGDFWELSLPQTGSWVWKQLNPDNYLKVSVPVTGLALGTKYHWQAWSTGSTSGDSAKASYGGNSDVLTAAVDFAVLLGIKVWNGLSWKRKPAMYWNGAMWVLVPVKVWNGISWIIEG